MLEITCMIDNWGQTPVCERFWDLLIFKTLGRFFELTRPSNSKMTIGLLSREGTQLGYLFQLIRTFHPLCLSYVAKEEGYNFWLSRFIHSTSFNLWWNENSWGILYTAHNFCSGEWQLSSTKTRYSYMREKGGLKNDVYKWCQKSKKWAKFLKIITILS